MNQFTFFKKPLPLLEKFEIKASYNLVIEFPSIEGKSYDENQYIVSLKISSDDAFKLIEALCLSSGHLYRGIEVDLNAPSFEKCYMITPAMKLKIFGYVRKV